MILISLRRQRSCAASFITAGDTHAHRDAGNRESLLPRKARRSLVVGVIEIAIAAVVGDGVNLANLDVGAVGQRPGVRQGVLGRQSEGLLARFGGVLLEEL